MANFFPLIANSAANTINELPAGDFLDLSQSGIANTGNITGSNIMLSGLLSASGNITGGNLITNGVFATTGNLSANNITANGAVINGIFSMMPPCLTKFKLPY